jgi:hypothetical protein
LAAGEVGSAEYDDAGEHLYNYDALHAMRIDDAASTIPIAREAYLVILHHYWERCCNSWMQTRKYVPDDAYKWLAERGLTPDCENLETLRQASNAIKHNNRSLQKRRPDLFEQPIPMPGMKTEAGNALHLPPGEIDKIFVAVKTSGIRFDSGFAPDFMPQPRPSRG